MKLSVTIITFNEEKNIARAIQSVSFANEIIVVDSYSTDRTCEIATGLGARIYRKEFLGYGQQKNYAAQLCHGEWILNIDADEEVDAELKDSIQGIISRLPDSTFSVYQINRRTMFCDKWIYHGGWYPDFLVRLSQKGQAQWSHPYVHEELIPLNSGELGELPGHLNHYSFPSVRSQIETNLKYATLGAEDLISKNRKISLLKLFFKPLSKFAECYLFKKGFLDGLAGLIIAVNAAYSMFMKYTFAYYLNKHNK